MSRTPEWIVAVTGASGTVYARRLVAVLTQAGVVVHLVVSDAGARVMAEEDGLKVNPRCPSPEDWGDVQGDRVIPYNARDIGAAIASGSVRVDGCVVVPCTMATLGAVATATPRNLIHRAADVTLKEGRRLILVPRETPLHAVHLEHMASLSRLGVRIVPAMPGFYHAPQSIDDLVDMMVMKITDQMGLTLDLVPRWKSRPDVASVPQASLVGRASRPSPEEGQP